MLVDLKKKPYYLNDSQIKWVENTIEAMSLDEKLRQLFVALTSTTNKDELIDFAKKVKMGGVRYNPMSKEILYNHNKILQENSNIPVLICANTESGGNGACKDGTEIGSETKVAATRDVSLAYELGRVSGVEAQACGVNTLFAPIVDIDNNFHNPIISNRTFGKDKGMVKEMSLAYLKGAKESKVLCCAKHFPGDGFDERDQHLAPSINPLSVKEWDESFGDIYSSLIDNGLDMIMAGHISLPSYQKFYSNCEDKDILPATLSKEIITDLLKTKLGFNGAVITDATHMVGLTCAMKRSDLIPAIIAAGCDMILFYNDVDEDFAYIKEGYIKGIITKERLNDALRRILGLKAKLNLHLNPIESKEEDLQIIGCEEHKKIAKKVAKKSITLVKNLEKDLLPINVEKNKRILIVIQEDTNPFEMFMPKTKTIYDYVKERLTKDGFEVTIFESLVDKAKKLPPQEGLKLIMNVYGNKTPIEDLTSKYDLVIHFADFPGRNTVQRISWKISKGTADIPWYVHEVPTIFVSLNCPFHLFDVPQVKTYINCYDKNKITIDSLINKLEGKEAFVGISPVDAFCGNEYTKY